MAQPVGFLQDPEGPPGAGSFQFDDGNELYAFEPGLAQQLGQQLAVAPDLRLAENAHAPQPNRFDELSDVQPGAPVAAPPPPDLNAGGMQQIPLGQPQGAPAPEAAPPPVPMVNVPGRNPAREAATAVPVPKTVTTTMEQAPDSPEMADARRFLNDEFEAAKLAEFESQQAIADRDAELARVKQAELEEKRVVQARDAAAKEDRYRAERARAQAHLEAAETRRIAPEHFYSSKSVPARAMLVISQALGAFAASMPGGTGSNWAQQIIDGMIDRDVAAQEDEIKGGRVSANNALARIQEDLGGDLEQAKTALRMTQQGIFDAHIRELAASDKSELLQATANTWLAENQQKRLAEEQKFRDQSFGKQTVTAQMVTPTQGGSRPMTLKEQAEAAKYRAEIHKADGYVAGKMGPDGKPLEEGADPKLLAEYGKRRQGAENLLGQVNDLVAHGGGKLDKDGTITFGDDIPGVGPLASRAPDFLLSEKGKRFRQELGHLAADVVKDKSGAAVTDKERADLMRVLQGGFRTEEQIQTGLSIVHRYGNRKLKNVESSFDGSVREAYRQNRGAAAAESREDDESDVETF